LSYELLKILELEDIERDLKPDYIIMLEESRHELKIAFIVRVRLI
jgi:hypothetical protein